MPFSYFMYSFRGSERDVDVGRPEVAEEPRQQDQHLVLVHQRAVTADAVVRELGLPLRGEDRGEAVPLLRPLNLMDVVREDLADKPLRLEVTHFRRLDGFIQMREILAAGVDLFGVFLAVVISEANQFMVAVIDRVRAVALVGPQEALLNQRLEAADLFAVGAVELHVLDPGLQITGLERTFAFAVSEAGIDFLGGQGVFLEVAEFRQEEHLFILQVDRFGIAEGAGKCERVRLFAIHEMNQCLDVAFEREL